MTRSKGLIVATLVLAGCGSGEGSEPEAQGQTNRVGPAEIDPNVYEPYTPDQYPRTFAAWGREGVRRIDALRVAAAETVAQNPACDRVEASDLSDDRSTPRQKPVVFVDCANMQRFYLGEADVGSPVQSQQQKSANFSRTELIERCTEATKRQLNFPSTMDRNIWSISAQHSPYQGNWVVEFDFHAKNAFGMDLPASARCVTTPEGQMDISVTPR